MDGSEGRLQGFFLCPGADAFGLVDVLLVEFGDAFGQADDDVAGGKGVLGVALARVWPLDLRSAPSWRMDRNLDVVLDFRGIDGQDSRSCGGKGQGNRCRIGVRRVVGKIDVYGVGQVKGRGIVFAGDARHRVGSDGECNRLLRLRFRGKKMIQRLQVVEDA